MPVLRYFLFVGGALLTLLLVINAVTLSPAPNEGMRSVTDLPLIRIHSDRKGPEAVVFDTSQPTIAPPALAKNEQTATAPAIAGGLLPKAPAREAFAQLVPPQAGTKVEKKPQPKRRISRANTRVRYGNPFGYPMMAAQQPQQQRFGFFTW